MKNSIFKYNIFILSLLCIFLLSGCSKYKYNFDNGMFTFQYDTSKLIVVQQENSNDIIVKPNDENTYCFIDTTITKAEYGEYDEILDYMKMVYTYNLDTEIQDIAREKSSIEIENYGFFEQSIYNYSYLENGKEVIVESKALNLGEDGTMVVIKKITNNVYVDAIVAALDTTYNSIIPVFETN